jgi:hypothetical protein
MRGNHQQLIALGPRMAGRRGIVPLFGTITAFVVVAGCGGSTAKTTTSSPTPAGQALAFAKCVRGHGVPNFPDPGTGATAPENTIGGVAIPSTINIQSPAFRAAWTACQPVLSSRVSGQGKPPITASLKASLIAHAQCMRTRGVPSYPDPTFPASGGIAFTDAGTNPEAPVYKHAAAVCASH